MATPQGTLLLSARQNNNGAKTRLIIFLIITVLTCILLLLAGAGGLAFLLALIPFLFVLVTLPYALRDDTQGSVYEDGSAFHRSQEQSLITEAQWVEIPNIKWNTTSNANSAAMVGAVSFGLVGGLIGSAIDNARRSNSETPQASAYYVPMMLNGKEKRFTLDKSYADFPAIERNLLDASARAWHDSALADLKAGMNVHYAHLLLTPEYISNGKQAAPWKYILNAEYALPAGGAVTVRWQEPDKRRESKFKEVMWLRGPALWKVIMDYRKIAR